MSTEQRLAAELYKMFAARHGTVAVEDHGDGTLTIYDSGDADNYTVTVARKVYPPR